MDVQLIAYTKGVKGETPEKIIEIAARTSYKSFSKMGEGTEKKLIKHIIRLGHLSVLEHASATFRVRGISRACTHQLVRHRLASFTQESQRYVNEREFDYVVPDAIKENKEAFALFRDEMRYIAEIYAKFSNIGIKKEDARFVLPNATTSEIVISANFREWLHIIGLRVSNEAQWEIRELSTLFWRGLYSISPTVFHVDSFLGYKDYDFKKEIFRKYVNT